MKQGRMKYADKSKEDVIQKEAKKSFWLCVPYTDFFFIFKIDSLYEES